MQQSATQITPVSGGLDAIFTPKNVAVIGATERVGSVGRTILWNLISTPFGGTVFPVNPTRPSILGIRAYPNIAAVPEKVDLAVIVTPAHTVPGVVQECADAGIKGVIIISAGFKEAGAPGIELERQVLEIARAHDMRIIGPNCLGVMRPLYGLNATFAAAIARPGNVAFISQSGALCTAVLDWSIQENVGFSAFISIGTMLDVGWGDLIYYLGDDPNTHSIVIYMESVGDARAFLSAAREVALQKPIIIIKPGRSEAAAHAAASHTGSLTGSDEVLDAAFRRSGVLRVERISDVFYMAEVLAKQPRPKGSRLTIVTNAGGPGVLATDALIQGGGEMAKLSDQTMDALNALLPPPWSHGNPVDILGDASPELYARSLDIVAKDPNSDGLLVILTPQAMSEPTQTAEALRAIKIEGKPLLASWMGGPGVAAGEAILNRANIPAFSFPDTAVHMFNYMWRYNYNLRGIYETPILPVDSAHETPDRARVAEILKQVRADGRTILSEYESKQVLNAYYVPTVATERVADPDAAVTAAEKIGYPVVLKLNSETITHKTDVGGVQLNLRDADSVRAAFSRIQTSVAEKVGVQHFQGVTVQPMLKLDGYELIVGSSIDPQFGPVLLFGTGGVLVEVFRDHALALPPLNTTLAQRMIEQTKIYQALKGVRGRKAVDLDTLVKVMVRFSQLVVEQPWIKEIDINPLLASSEQIVALDARVVLHPLDTPEEKLPRSAIRPYPVQYVDQWVSKRGINTTIRPIRPEDEPLMVKFNESLSERSVYMRYLQMINLSQRTGHERLSRLSFIDYDREIALVAVRSNPATNEPEVMGVGRLRKQHNANRAEFGLIVSDQFQHQGVGKELL
ncbi:MAG TPA: acetate--CoA ligase family protein, partial [Phototrophicaceae bacterium]|nr:acetate--CoA ligase family protein [Phototrophicaceae bacterium]